MGKHLNKRERQFCEWYSRKYQVPIDDVFEHEGFMKQVRHERKRRMRPASGWLGKPK